ncbi:hypothetical protein L596_017208 [Steinernema carpocapsae]|uniref:Uncharacterized protein n=1 Tax=Steinernema carpocapsae TaxID=34508 RepID=A0A4U5N0Y3_STECR|nr:hypothetical protein L596_017208 [Steinernema carpocapsae]
MKTLDKATLIDSMSESRHSPPQKRVISKDTTNIRKEYKIHPRHELNVLYFRKVGFLSRNYFESVRKRKNKREHAGGTLHEGGTLRHFLVSRTETCKRNSITCSPCSSSAGTLPTTSRTRTFTTSRKWKTTYFVAIYTFFDYPRNRNHYNYHCTNFEKDRPTFEAIIKDNIPTRQEVPLSKTVFLSVLASEHSEDYISLLRWSSPSSRKPVTPLSSRHEIGDATSLTGDLDSKKIDQRTIMERGKMICPRHHYDLEIDFFFGF